MQADHAVAAVEFALIAPILLLFVGGVVEFGRAFQVFEAVNRLTAQYAIVYADCSDNPAGTCATELANYTNQNAVQNIVPQIIYSRLSLQMFQVSMNTKTPYAVTVTYPAGGNLTAAQTVAVQAALTTAALSAFNNNSGQASVNGVIVTASYTHSLAYFPTLMGSFLSSYLSPTYTVVQLKSS
jgi:Flp pilus assembly protein TadG